MNSLFCLVLFLPLAPSMWNVKGVWRTRETRNDGSSFPIEEGKLAKKGICKGRLSFKGFVGAQKGTVEYRGCGDREGKGRWLTKPKNIVNGRCVRVCVCVLQ